MKLLHIPILFSVCILTPLIAIGAEDLSPEDQLELDRLMGVLDKHTDIATVTKMNADYIPGMVTVLEGRDMEARGKRNVMEALTLVPGLDISISQGGTPSMTSRGIGSPYLPATSLIMLDGITMNSTTSGTGSVTFGIPIEQIERIEIIRGPGTAVNGEFAYNSVINIITRKDGNNIHGSYGDFDTYSGGGIASYNNPEQEIKFSVNMATSGTDSADRSYGPDNFSNFGETNEDRELDAFFANFSYHNFSIIGSHIDAGQGDFFNPFPICHDEITSTQTVSSIEAKQQLAPIDNLDMIFKLGWQSNETDLDQVRLVAPGVDLTPIGLIGPYPEGIGFGFYNSEEKFSSSLETTWKAAPTNTVTFAINYNYTKLTNTETYGNFDPITYQPIDWQQFSDESNFLDGDTTRNHVAVALQDEYQLNTNITIMAGLRYDHYSDVEDDQITPRISGVWQPSENHIFKLQYARAFRPPTFTELTGNANLVSGNEKINSEIIDTYEIGYIYRANTIITKITLFYSDLDDLITTEVDNIGYRYTNNASATQMGFELEYKQDILSNLEFDGNLSYATTKDDDTQEEVVNARNWLVNLGLTYSPFDWTSINTQYRFVDKRYRADTDPRSDLDCYDVVDLTLSFFPPTIQGLTLRTGLKNIFEDDAYVSSAQMPFYGTAQADDYQVLDRFWWVQASYEF